MRTSGERRASWLTNWARPRVWADGPEAVQFTVAANGDVILPPTVGGPRHVLLDGVDHKTDEPVQAAAGVIDEEQFAWEPYNIADAHVRLEAEHDAARSAPDGPNPERRKPRYSEERAGLYTDFSRLPVLGEGEPHDKVVSEYVAWCNRWGSPGLFAFLFTIAGQRRRKWYIQEKRTGVLSSEGEFYKLYREADVGDERYREPVRVEWLSREVELLRHALTLRMLVQGHDVDADELRLARDTLLAHLPYPQTTITETWEDDAGREVMVGGEEGAWRPVNELGQDVDPDRVRPRERRVLLPSHGLQRGLPTHEEGVYLHADDDVLAAWLWMHASGSRLAFTRDPRAHRPACVWVFDSFIGTLYHLLLEDLMAGQAIRRCADPKCRVFFRPKRDAEYHDLKCRTRVRLEADRRGVRHALELHDGGVSTQAIAKQLGWTPEKTERELQRALDVRTARQDRAKEAGKRPKDRRKSGPSR